MTKNPDIRTITLARLDAVGVTNIGWQHGELQLCGRSPGGRQLAINVVITGDHTGELGKHLWKLHREQVSVMKSYILRAEARMKGG
jgi:hypothetical protein